MNRVVRALPQNPDLQQYKKQAKQLVKAHAAGDAEAAARIRAWLPEANALSAEEIFARRFTLSAAQLVLAREHGFESWPKLKQRIETLRAERGDSKAELEMFKSAVELGDAPALRAAIARFPGLKAHLDEPLFPFDKPAIVAAKDHPELLIALLDAGADINARSSWPRGAYGALDDAKPVIAEMLIERGARLSIHSAAQLGKLGAVQEFLAADPELVHLRGPDGKLPLHCASTPDIVEVLLDFGAEIDARDVDHPDYDGYVEVFRLLIAAGAQVDPAWLPTADAVVTRVLQTGLRRT